MGLLRRKPPPPRGEGERTIFFASDLHGSEVCFRKFVAAAKFYGADTLLLGGDISAKIVVPIVSAGPGRSIDYFAGLGMQSFQNSFVRRLFLGLSLAANLGLLVLSRHMTLFLQPSNWDWIFPLSLSFYAFQSLSYTIDIYRKDAPAASTYVGYMAAASFFPTIQAGPITRPAEILKQLTRRFELAPADGSRALFLIVFGLLKKLLIADYLAGNLVNRVFDTPNLYSGMENLAAVYAYSLELYYDFSGYTDIARGCGLLLGVRLPINFDRPYTSVNMADFWRRWHITFSNWLRDYLYFSLPGKRTRVWPYINLV